MNISKQPFKLYASAKAVIALYLSLPGTDRIQHVIQKLEKLSQQESEELMKNIMHEFGNRHRNIEQIFLNHYRRTALQYGKSLSHFRQEKQLLLGAFFTKEYSIEAAALFNPSMVPHPNQTGLKKDEKRFVMSLRATGEGHISSIVFKTGTVDLQGNISLDTSTPYNTCLQKMQDAMYENNPC